MESYFLFFKKNKEWIFFSLKLKSCAGSVLWGLEEN